MPDVLVCAGLDPSGGAGLVADVRVVSELGARPCGVVTALTIQNTTGVVGSHPCDPDVVGHQLAFLMTDVEMKAIKIGMVGSAAIARAIANALHLSAAPVVWDPVMFASRGNAPLTDDIEEVMLALRPHLTLVTPNKQELFLMTGLPTGTPVMAEAAARTLARKLDTAVLIKGGHLGGDESVDVLIHAGNPGPMIELRSPRILGGEDVHGTGCALSSAIATYLANGRELDEAVQLSKQYVTRLIENPVHPGRGAAAVR
ncbi:MAG TPA: bifunctional hydroxymethylpyrimidine kinase/phosphomethylpyrimidine kinase [Kofleriaceae bacterium]|nr:bifunctional hydroxymethylpyrimidine kinase/phosphomethylpyrimidine kinase [Kofleriaceae bacterium]